MMLNQLILLAAAETFFYVAVLMALAWLYFQTLLKLAEWQGGPPRALALTSYVMFMGIGLQAPLLAVERALGWVGNPARSSPDVLLWIASFVVSFGALFCIHRRRLQDAGYFRR